MKRAGGEMLERLNRPGCCLTCKFLDEPKSKHKWHRCKWEDYNDVPIVMVTQSHTVNITPRYIPTGCPAWEKRS